MQNGIEHILNNSYLFQKNTPLLIACSGGRDSMALLHAFIQLGFSNIEVAHCNFQLRAEESDGDQKFIEKFCEDHHIPIHSIKFNTKDIAKMKGNSTQMAARELRYEWMEKIRKENHLHLIVVAHHQNDQVETLLLNLVQGTGIHGLKGMLHKTEKIVRPLLSVSRDEIDKYIIENKIPYREDSSNASNDYKRNLLRHEILPILSQLNPNYLNELSDFSQRMKESEFLFQKEIDTIKKKVLKPWKEGLQLYTNYILLHPACDTIFYEILSPYNLSKLQIQELSSTIKGLKKKNASGQTFLSKTHRFILDKKSLFILPLDTELSSYITYESFPRQIIFNEYKIDVRLQPIQKVNLQKSARYAFIDAEKVQFPLRIQYAETGDYFYPFGMGKSKNPNQAGKKKLSKYFKDEQISSAERERIPILKSAEKIAWIVGHRMDDRFKITENTKNVLVLVITKQ